LTAANDRLERELVERQKMVEILHQHEAELKDLLQKLERSNRDLQDFAYIASHDLQEPLRKVQAFAQRLTKRSAGQLDEDSLGYLERMNSAASRMQAMVNDLLMYSARGQREENRSIETVANRSSRIWKSALRAGWAGSRRD
jgi:light-regulated signal transduction histidine kinase (bacteriophytochrome)